MPITGPTRGRAVINGRVGSLLEVGTGFHPELTGRENIYLNGAILGMTRKEIDKKFDEIVAFAEIEKFLDTPVKRYSSGMYVRLAFAVAAHLTYNTSAHAAVMHAERGEVWQFKNWS
jgi:lipopolysaccharide transport system ATP-binding protein